MRVLLFARARDIIGADRIDIALPAGTTVAELRRTLAETYPALAPLLARSALAVENEFADESLRLPADAEVALLPPVSGG